MKCATCIKREDCPDKELLKTMDEDLESKKVIIDSFSNGHLFLEIGCNGFEAEVV
jgi:hypothetical protein